MPDEILDLSPPGLVDSLCKRFTSALKSFWQEGEYEDEPIHVPYVHAQYLPVSMTEDEERDKTKDYPLVQVVCTTGTINDFSEVPNGSEINIEIYFAGYRDNPDNQGWRIPALMLWRVLQDLLSNTIEGGYQLIAPIEWSALNDKEPPYYTALIETKWKGYPPAVEVPDMRIPGVNISPGKENTETFDV